jgi:hypothetical protein
MTGPGENPDLDERLARLAARRAASSGSKAESADPAAQDRIVARGPERKRRAHPAAAGRILAAGLSTSAFFSLMAAFAARAPAAGTPVVAAAPPAGLAGATGPTRHQKPKIVTKVRHHTVYVDQYGHRISPPQGQGAATFAPAPLPSGPVAPVGTSAVTAPPAAAPVATPVTATPAPPPATSPPATVPPPAPPPTAPPTTVFTPPPPPPPPPCSGTKCP